MAVHTSVDNVKTYLAVTTAGQDKLIAQLIPRESRMIEKWTRRTIPFASNTKTLNGTGSDVQLLPSSPILSVTSLSIGGVLIDPSKYTHDECAIYLTNDIFPQCRQNVAVSWTSGWAGTLTAFIPVGNVLQPVDDGFAAIDNGVVNAVTGLPLTAVGGVPVAGQYAFAAGVYTFSAADHTANVKVTCSYNYVPAPIEQACIEMVALDLQGRTSVGLKTKTLGAEVISFEDGGMTGSVQDLLQPYREMAPV